MGVTICASSTAASTDLVPTGRTTAAQILRVAASNAIDNSTDPVTPSASTTSTSSGVLSSITSSPGRSVTVGVRRGVGCDVRRRPQQSMAVGERVHQPVERRHRRHLHRAGTMGLLQNPPDHAPQPAQRAS
ncbi:hypothetical protein ACFT8W_17610 [Streptomyces hygroscopicus]|uniref:hypothetical protein n=1 Tax=Streptomyces hygroscopicus TaxID=1912 RepID=UPI00362A56F5